MKRLSGLDAAFLALESEQWPAHVACVTVFDPAECPNGYSSDALKKTLEDRLHLLPPFRWRVVEPPLGLGRPHWIEDPDFDLDWHFHRVALPAPGGRKELAELASEIYRHRLDRRRPLWELWVIEGLEHGYVAVFWKIHHACIDGMSGAAMQEVMFDRDPKGLTPVEPPVDVRVPEQPPSPASLLMSSLPSFAATPVRLIKHLGGMLADAPGVVRASRAGNIQLTAPRTSFNAPVTQHRTWGFCSLNLSDIKLVKNTFGVKVNDVVLSVTAGALRSYLLDRDELPEDPLIASVPVNIREGAATGGNMISGMAAALYTNIEDPVERLQQIYEGTQAAKLMQEAMGADMLMGLADTPPPMMLSLALRFYGKTQLVKRLPPLFNLPISNVPGPREPLYVQGAPIKAFYSMGIIFDGIGVFIGGMSYQDQMDFGVLACQELVEDPFVIADGMVEELNRLVKAAKAAAPAITPKAGGPKAGGPKAPGTGSGRSRVRSS